MKKLFNLVVVIAAASIFLTGCSKDDDSSTATSGTFTSSGDVNATIDGLSSSGVDSLYFSLVTDINNDIFTVIGKTKVQNGAFSIKLDSIPNRYLFAIKESGLFDSDDLKLSKLTVSDPTAYTTEGEGLFIDAYKSGKYIGSLVKTNCTLAQYNTSDLKLLSKGLAVGYYVYCNKSVNIKGASSETDTDDDGVAITYNYNYNVSFNKGWNQLVMQITDISGSSATISMSANTEPSGMKWLFVPSDNEDMKSIEVNSALKQSVWKSFITKKEDGK